MTDESWSQGRLAPERLSPGTGARYIHEYLRVATIAESKGALGMGMAQEKASPYSVDRVETHLNSRAEEGWRLVSMEPHWVARAAGHQRRNVHHEAAGHRGVVPDV